MDSLMHASSGLHPSPAGKTIRGGAYYQSVKVSLR